MISPWLQARNARVEQLAHSRNIDEKHEERLAELAEERARKVEEREAKEAKAQQRRKDMEDRRLRKMEAMREKIRTREERIQVRKEGPSRDCDRTGELPRFPGSSQPLIVSDIRNL